MESKLLKERLKFFCLGMLVVLGVVFLMGAANHSDQVVIDNGRYQVAAWGDGTAHGAFITDTISGETKIVYRYKEKGNDRGLERSNLNKPFSKIKE
ncbi:MAG: hypothetical protein AMK71_12760 [Nitrospira bacterium SG8_35_4]|nr:MAG: hypothetical protein AMK71_12760 [Nitrospira bacterium SG8_35_4]